MIIVGLGNPGEEYAATRHNIGFRILDRLADGDGWTQDRQVQYLKSMTTLLIKPWSFMNESGSALRDFLTYKHVAWETMLDDIIVVHDDLDLALGAIKPDFNRSSGGHQGVASIIETLGTQAFRRLRVGIGSNRPLNIPSEDYVLQVPPPDDTAVLRQAEIQAVAWLKEEMKKKPPQE